MKVKTLALCIFMFFLCNISISAEEKKSWFLVPYPFDKNVVGSGINSMVEKGYYPVGVEVTSGKFIYILYSNSEKLATKEWLFYVFEDFKKVNDEMEKIILKGFVPMDITIKKEGIYAVFLKKDWIVTGFKIEGVDPYNANKEPNTKEQFLSDIQNYLGNNFKKGFVPMGISIQNSIFYNLVVGIENKDDFKSFDLKAYKNDGVETFKGIDEEIEKNNKLIPWGITMDKDYIWISYISLKDE